MPKVIHLDDSGTSANKLPWKFSAVNYADLSSVAPSADEGDLAIVYNSSGVWPINRRLKGVYIYQGGVWEYANQELQDELQASQYLVKANSSDQVPGFLVDKLVSSNDFILQSTPPFPSGNEKLQWVLQESNKPWLSPNNPTVNDDSTFTNRHRVGQVWVNTTSRKVFIAASIQAGLAIWVEIQNKRDLGWVQVTDTEFTNTSRRVILSNVRTKLTNNAGNLLNVVGMLNGTTIWNATTNKFEPDNSGDTYDWRVQFTLDPSLNNRNVILELDIGGTQGVIWDKTLRLARGAGVDTRITETIDLFTLGTFVANGGELFITVDGDVELYDTVFKIERKYRN